MELKEIKARVAGILESLNSNNQSHTRRKFDTFVTGAGNKTPGNVALLKRFDSQFKKHGLSLHCGRETRKSILDFNKHETVTFRRREKPEHLLRMSGRLGQSHINMPAHLKFARKKVVSTYISIRKKRSTISTPKSSEQTRIRFMAYWYFQPVAVRH